MDRVIRVIRSFQKVEIIQVSEAVGFRNKHRSFKFLLLLVHISHIIHPQVVQHYGQVVEVKMRKNNFTASPGQVMSVSHT